LDEIIDWGYEYIKMDFNSHGAAEGIHYDPSVGTGMQAYNEGMKFIYDYIEEHSPALIFLSLSISPMYSGRYAHARRVCCDVFEEPGNTRYLLNSLTYAWWTNGRLITFNDPDHLVMYKSFWRVDWPEASDREAVAALNTRLVGGLLLWSDNLAYPEAAARAKAMLNNPALMELANGREVFRPAGSGDASQLFYLKTDGKLYLAFFNTSKLTKSYKITPGRYGVYGDAVAINLNTGNAVEMKKGVLKVRVPSHGSVMVRIENRR